jgi:hypothetical protein
MDWVLQYLLETRIAVRIVISGSTNPVFALITGQIRAITLSNLSPPDAPVAGTVFRLTVM